MRILLSIIFSFLTLLATPISKDIDFINIYKDVKNTEKITLMIYTTKSCPQCAYMKQKVFKDKFIKNILDEHFSILQKDVQVDELPDGFKYFGIPTIFFIDKDANKLGEFIGSCRAKEFSHKLKEIIKKAKN